MKKSDLLSDMLLDGFRDEESSPINIKEILVQYLRYWWLFLISLIVIVALAIVYLFFATPLYSVSSSILIKVNKSSDFTQNIVMSDLEAFETTKQVENEIEVLGSYSLMRDAIEDLPLHASFYVVDRFSREKELYGKQVPISVIVHEEGDGSIVPPDDRRLNVYIHDENFEIESSENSRKTFDYGEKIQNWYGIFSIEKQFDFNEDTPRHLIVALNNKDQLASRYNGRLRVAVSNKFASVLNLSLTDAVPEKGKDILNRLIEEYNHQAVKEKNITAENTIAFIDQQLSTLIKELGEVEEKIEAYKRNNSITSPGSEYSSFVENTRNYEAQLSRNKIQLEVLESIESYLNSSSNMGAEVPSNLSIEDGTLVALISRFNQLRAEKDRFLRTTQPSNPLVVSLDEQLTALKSDIRTNLTNIKNSLRIENRNLSASINRLDARLSRVPEIERGLLELTREQNRKQEQYLYLQNKREESELSLAATTISNARVIDTASASSSPVKPNQVVILGMALMLSIVFPIGFVYIKSNISNKILKKIEVQKIIPFPIIGEVSHSKEKSALAMGNKKRTPIAEQFRLLRTNLKFLHEGEPDRVILVTSSIGGEGKTFFSLNLGSSLSLANKKVVVLEFDLRKPALLSSVNLKSKRGISDYLSRESISLDELIIESEIIDGLSFIGCGAIPEDPAELMLSPKAGFLIKCLKERFDYIIIDTAPVGTVSDAFNLSPYIDLALVLVRYNYTSKDNLIFLEELKLNNKLKKTMIVMNDAKIGNGYYGYNYGYGYTEKDIKRRRVYS
ncbi:GumC family protein [Negadavirga shengliensis]|uniref:non-specific protein-tyrosine kinase n=1 Tax=Negadavirga shengliensis TaxID=1389218 RepID=A0ABV9T326_9BACT